MAIKKKFEVGLIHVSDEEPGYSRKKSGRGFTYLDELQNKVDDPKELERIKNIGIPPMWQRVWICKSPSGYLQATGYDSKNRKQYLYHEDWTIRQQETKFEKIKEFARALPVIRDFVENNLKKKSWPKEKVVALVIGILDKTYVRIGNQQYLNESGTAGLTTLRRKNLEIHENGVVFKYKGKSQNYRKLKIKNPQFKNLIKACSELRGYEIFRYEDKKGKTVPVDSNDINEYLKMITGEKFTSKNFRTWGGTILAVKKYPVARQKKEENKRLKLRRAIVKEVAKELNNTIAVSEKYYIHPKVLDSLDENFSTEDYNTDDMPERLSEEEKIALTMITE